ncbi:MAG: aminopeptidase P family protein [Candidatus Thorarchaeota archaeon]|nr:aminopeptidase P family protein [Candidatus Thorarchaeota archaeon]
MQFTPQRLEKVHRSMRAEEIDAIIVTRKPDVQYLTGYQPPQRDLPVACVVVDGHQPHLIVSETQRKALSLDLVMAKVVTFPEIGSPEWFLAHSPQMWNCAIGEIRDLGAESGMVGFQQDWVSVLEFDVLKKSLPKAGFCDFSKNLWRLRQTKDPSEIESIKAATKIAEIGLRTALEIVVPGKTEEEASVEIEAAIRGSGGQQEGIRAAVLSGRHGSFPFVEPSAERIGNDELALIDITVSHDGYFAEISRTLHTGSPDANEKSLFDSVLKVSLNLEKLMAPHLRISKLAAKCVEEILSTKKRRVLGSSIGLDLREPPQIQSNSTYSLREGMVFSAHPTFYDEEVGTAKIADMLLITENGCSRLTDMTRETL